MRYYRLSHYFRQSFGRRVQKVPLDAGFGCPNRDGTLSTTGCVFCNSRGSGTGFANQDISLTEQWVQWTERLGRKYKNAAFMAYLQSYSNTYGPVEKFRKVLEKIQTFENVSGIAVGTRPDCIDAEKVKALAEFPVPEKWLELGLQSAHNTTLAATNRGHTVEDFTNAVNTITAGSKNPDEIKICVHVIIGLPGEGADHIRKTIEYINELPVAGIKFHNLYVSKHSTLGRMFERGEFSPMRKETYISLLTDSLARLRPDIVVQRLTGDAAPGELAAPEWAGRKSELMQAIRDRLEQEDIVQGQCYCDLQATFAETGGIPPWFSDE